MIKPDILDALSDDELRGIIAQSHALLKNRDEDRKAKALSDARALRAKAENDARALLESVGLTLKSLGSKAKKKAGKAPHYKGGRLYRHPQNESLVWKANGQKPNWLRELEAQGGSAVEVEGERNGAMQRTVSGTKHDD